MAAILAAKQKLANAAPGTAGKLSAEIAGIIASAVSTTRTIQTSAASSSGSASALEAARQSAREAVSEFEDAYFKQRKFDAYLKFESEEDERRYRERETERQLEIERAKAQGTPQGDKRAIELSMEQMRDAGAHGADKSPDFAPMMTKLDARNIALEAQLNASKPRTTASAIVTPDPLDDAPSAAVPSDLLAKFKASGVVVADQSGTGHGVTVSAGQQDQSPRLPS